ncbi:MAG: energy transducer TonB [Helicobacteraceae bacterium]|jgi:protein TonB|nr:energy transducer TonB [Helicobacteraceae bacterium]
MFLLRLVQDNPLVRGGGAVLLGAIATFATLWFMALATAFAPYEHKSGDFDKIVEFIRLREESSPSPQSRPIAPPKPTPPPEMLAELNLGIPNESSAYAFAIDSSMLSTSGLAIGRGVAERGLTPMSGIAPNYPRAAKMRGIEGAVELEFVITESGEVTDVMVVTAINGDWFVETAVRAISRWRFAPKMVNGKPTRQLARQVFTFKLE